MRLTCPSCGAEYEVPEGMVPPGGRHVQCTDCHTRWFVRGGVRAIPSEDQIIRRLETWSARPRPVAVPDPPPAPAAEIAAATPFDWEGEEPEAVQAPAADPPAPAAVPQPMPRAAAVPQPRPITAPLLEPSPARAAGLRLDLNPELGAEPAPRGPSRFRHGVMVALALFLLALAAYRFADPIAARAPALAPAVQGFAGVVDGLRDGLREGLGGG